MFTKLLRGASCPTLLYTCQHINRHWFRKLPFVIWPSRTNFSEIWIEILTFSFKKMHLKTSAATWRPSCLGLNVIYTDLQPWTYLENVHVLFHDGPPRGDPDATRLGFDTRMQLFRGVIEAMLCKQSAHVALHKETHYLNSLAPGRFESMFRYTFWGNFSNWWPRYPVIDDQVIPCGIVLWWLLLNLTDDKSTLVQVMAWCRQATSHYLSQCWLRSMSPYGVTRPQRVFLYTVAQWPYMVSCTSINIGAGNAFLHHDTSSLPEPKLTYHPF